MSKRGFLQRPLTKKVAEKIYHKVMAQVAEGKWFERLPGEEKTFREMMEKYMKEYSERNKSLKSHIRDKSVSDHLNQFFGDLTLSNVTSKLVSEYKTKRREEAAAPPVWLQEIIIFAINTGLRQGEILTLTWDR